MSKRYVHVGYRLDAQGELVAGPFTQEYSVDPWDPASPGYVIYDHQGVEYEISERAVLPFLSDEDRAQFLAVIGE